MARRSSSADTQEDDEAPDRQRLDKWVWFARFCRQREAAAELIRKGRVRVNGKRATQPGQFVRIGDVLTLALPHQTCVVEIIGFAKRRGDAEAARHLYREILDGLANPVPRV